MVQGPALSAIATLRDETASPDQRLDILKELLNFIIGQDLRKVSAVKNGIVQPLADILAATTKVTGKRKLDPNGTTLGSSSAATMEDELTLHAAHLVGSLADGGTSFVRPLCAANMPRILIEALAANAAPKLHTAILQAICSISTFLPTGDDGRVEVDFWRPIFNYQTLEVFNNVLSQPAASNDASKQIKLGLKILANLPDSGSESNTIKEMLVSGGILDTLASLLVSCSVHCNMQRFRGRIPQAPPPLPRAFLPGLLDALSTLASGSSYRVHRFILSRPVQAFLWVVLTEDGCDPRTFGLRNGSSPPDQSLLPSLHVPAQKTVSHTLPASNNFPALRSLQSGKSGPSLLDASPLIGDPDQMDAVRSWLLIITRALHGADRLFSLRLLALVINAIEPETITSSTRPDYAQRTLERERQLAFLAVPLAAFLVQTANEGKGISANPQVAKDQVGRDHACTVFALLIKSSKELQIAAVEVGVIKHVCPILKRSFDNVSLAKPMWPGNFPDYDNPDAANTCQLGALGMSAEFKHAMKCRQSALEAIAAITAKEDLHRKAIIETGVVSCIIASLKPFPPGHNWDVGSGQPSLTPKDGNTTEVILAACQAAQSISRSVNVLRTSLIDGGIAKPLIELLNYASVQVQIAATDVCVNLMPEFSPMRDDLSDPSVIKTLAEHARSSTPALRLSSLWALKHLMYSSPKEVKLATLEELGTGWLVGIIQGEPRDLAPSSAGSGGGVGLSTANAAGEQVNLLNPSSMDVDESYAAGEGVAQEEDEDGEVLYDEASSTHYQASRLRSTLTPPPPSAAGIKRFLAAIRELEQDDEYAARRDEALIQEQALDFVRNFICGENCAAMADTIMNQIGSAKFYELLTAKLLPFPRVSTGAPQVYNTTELIYRTIHVIIHVANASPKYRQMLIAQKPLLQALTPHFSHLDARVRVACVWCVNSLTWIEEDGDRRDAHLRARELKALGLEHAVRALQNDPDRDVRERVKTAIHQFDAM